MVALLVIVRVVLLGLKEVQGLVIVMGIVEILVVFLVSLVVKKEELLQISSHRSGVLVEGLVLDEVVNSLGYGDEIEGCGRASRQPYSYHE